MRREICLGVLVLAAGLGCGPAGESWAESKLGVAGAQQLRAEAQGWFEAHMTEQASTAPEAARCPAPRALLDGYRVGQGESDIIRLEYSKLNKQSAGAAGIHGVADVRCLVVAAHAARGKKRNFREWMTVHLVDRSGGTGQVTRIEGNDEELIAFLDALP